MNEELYISVKKYISGDLTESEVLAFEKKVEEDSHFRAQVELYASMIEAISYKGDEELGLELMSLGKTLLQSEEPQKTKIRKFQIPYYIYAIAATILLLIIIIPIWPPSSRTPEQLFSSNFEVPYSAVRSGNGDNPRIDSLENDWKIAYDAQNYSDAASTLNVLLADSTYQNHSEAYYFLGVSQLAIGNPDAALDALNSIEEGFEFQEKVKWYIALAFLKKENIPEVQKRLQAIVEDDMFKNSKDLREIYEKSQDILKRLPKE